MKRPRPAYLPESAPAIERYPPIENRITEAELYAAHGAPERPEAADLTESGLRHGEPMSRGRTARNGDQG